MAESSADSAAVWASDGDSSEASDKSRTEALMLAFVVEVLSLAEQPRSQYQTLWGARRLYIPSVGLLERWSMSGEMQHQAQGWRTTTAVTVASN